jgi:ketosteroid isomerase-like protein
MQERQDVEVVEAAIRLWNEGNRENFLALFHPDGVWSSAIKRQLEGGDGLYRGQQELGAFWDEWHAVWKDLEISVSEIHTPREGCAFAWGALRARGSASGAGAERPFGWVFRVENGLIQEVRAYLTREEALEAAGMSE